MEGSAASPAPDTDKKLDDVMLAMDVVDTLRHRTQLVERELDAERREQALIKRLREIYDAQGISVPDSVLREGVKALEEQRFSYTPPKPSISVSLAKLYVSRGRWGKPFAGAAAALAVAVTGYQVGIAGPARDRAAATEQALNITLPQELSALRETVQAAAEEDVADTLAETIYQDGIAAVDRRDEGAARAALQELRDLQTDIGTSYEVTVVSRPRERSGVFRVPDDVPNARNYYLIVEAVDARGRALPVTIRSEEDQQTKRVSRWGQRVSEGTYNRVAADKQDDQIIQDAVIGIKRPGRLTPEFSVETPGGAILEW